MAVRIQKRRGTAAQWTTENPILLIGEPGYETDTGKEKTGDGVTAWTSLPYNSGGTGATTFTQLTDVPSAYTGQAGKVVAVKGDESGLEFVIAGGGGSGNGFDEIILNTSSGTLDDINTGTGKNVLIAFTGSPTVIGAVAKNEGETITMLALVGTLTIQQNASGTPANNIQGTGSGDIVLANKEAASFVYLASGLNKFEQYGEAKKDKELSLSGYTDHTGDVSFGNPRTPNVDNITEVSVILALNGTGGSANVYADVGGAPIARASTNTTDSLQQTLSFRVPKNTAYTVINDSGGGTASIVSVFEATLSLQ